MEDIFDITIGFVVIILWAIFSGKTDKKKQNNNTKTKFNPRIKR
jgi:hypothetical protein